MILGMHGAVFLVLLASALVDCNIQIHQLYHDQDPPIADMDSKAALFGRPLPVNGTSAGFVYLSSPIDGCRSIQQSPPSIFIQNFVLMSKGVCTFEQKVRIAQEARYDGAIVFNPHSDQLFAMPGSNSSLIPSVFIGLTDGNAIIEKYLHFQDTSVFLVLKPDDHHHNGDDGSGRIFVIAFSTCFAALAAILVSMVAYKCWHSYCFKFFTILEVDQIPTILYKLGDPSETCCICLEDFVQDERLRMLPCHHVYHPTCIDPWLSRHDGHCPQCRRRILGDPEENPRMPTDELSQLLDYPSLNPYWRRTADGQLPMARDGIARATINSPPRGVPVYGALGYGIVAVPARPHPTERRPRLTENRPQPSENRPRPTEHRPRPTEENDYVEVDLGPAEVHRQQDANPPAASLDSE